MFDKCFLKYFLDRQKVMIENKGRENDERE